MPAIEGPKPAKTLVEESNIPPELKSIEQWCLWRFIEVGGKWTKPPVSPKTFKKASYKESMISYAKAMSIYAQHGEVDGIGFVPGKDDPYICLDLDSCVVAGKPNQFAKNVVRASQSYAEISPSGRGVRVIVKGELDIPADKGKAVNGTFEAFQSTGYCTITGNRVSGSGIIAKRGSFMRAVNQGLIHCKDERAAVISALFHCEPEEDYDDWLKMLMALHSFDEDLLWLADLWSSLASSYEDSESVAAKWKSFNADREQKISIEYLYSIAEKSGWVRPTEVMGSKPPLRNCKHIDKSRTVIIPIETIYDQFVRYADKMWCENGSLVFNKNGKPVFLSRPTEFTCYLHEKFIPDFSGKGIKEVDFFTYVKSKVEQVKSVETAPFFPPIANLAYVHESVVPGDGKTLEAWLDQWSFATICDRWLAECMIYTLFCDVAAGKRPLFLIMSEGATKHGSGKTTLAERTAALISDDDCYYEFDGAAAFAQEMGVEKKQSKRVVLLDNINGSDLQGKKLDKLVTASEIKARRMYVGPVSVPNLFTWIATVNHGKPHQDTASRTVVIRLVKPAKYTPLPKFDRAAIWADVKAFFARDAVQPQQATRRPEWDLAIAGRMEDPEMIISLINQRAAEIDGTKDDASDWESLFHSKIMQHDLDPTSCACWISNRDLLQMGLATGLLKSGSTSMQVSYLLSKLTPHLPIEMRRKNHSRGWNWVTASDQGVTSISE